MRPGKAAAALNLTPGAVNHAVTASERATGAGLNSRRTRHGCPIRCSAFSSDDFDADIVYGPVRAAHVETLPVAAFAAWFGDAIGPRDRPAESA